jgi:hypothetical protein
MRPKSIAVALLLALSFAGCVKRYRPVDEVKAATVNLEQEMSQEEVRALLGPPDQVEGSICGQRTQQAWKCVVWQYRTDNPYMALTVRFQPGQPGDRGEWIVNSWDW